MTQKNHDDLLTVALQRYLIRDPLRHVPGPRIARWTGLWIRYSILLAIDRV